MPIYKGNTKIVKLYKGTTQIVKRYKGTDLIYSASRLPAEFQEVEYLESTGKQYIDSGFASTSNIRFVANVIPVFSYGVDQKYAEMLFGIRKTSNRSNFFLSSGQTNVYIGNGNQSSISITRFPQDYINDKYTIDFSRNYISITSEHYNYTNSSLNATILDLLNIYIFTRNTDGALSGLGTYKLYSCQIYDNGTLVRDFVPCYRKADNVAGLYDLVNGVFYTNAGTGTFIVGGNV